MTREEAIGIWLPMVLMAVHDSPQCEEAVKMAGRALEQELILAKIRAEIEQMPSELTTDGRRMIRRGSVFRIIDKYRAESEDKDADSN